MDRLQSNRSGVLERVAAVCRSCGRDSGEVRVVAVTKSVGPEVAAELAALGSPDLGESRVDALAEKRRFLAERGLEARWHFVGHLQRNKARRALALSDEIHSVDTAELFDTLSRVAVEEGRRPGIYLQVKLYDEPAKSGLAPRDVPALVERARSGPLPLLGLMTMAPLIEDADEARHAARGVFDAAAELARDLPAAAFADGRVRLSMGMTQDYGEALHAGAHVLRIGSAFFEGLENESRDRDASEESEESAP